MYSDDQALWQSYRDGDKLALGKLAERYYRRLKHYGLKFSISEFEVDDCIQELFLRLWQNRSQINPTISVRHYLLKALRHHIVQHVRQQKHTAVDDLDWDNSVLFDETINPESLLIQKESLSTLVSTLKAQLEALPPREREAIYLRYYENLSIPEIAEVMNVNRQSVSNFLQKALHKLRGQWVTYLFSGFCIFFQKNLL